MNFALSEAIKEAYALAGSLYRLSLTEQQAIYLIADRALAHRTP